MKRRILIPFAYLLLVGLGVFIFKSLPPWVDRKANSLYPRPTEDRDIQIPALHKTLFISDFHADTLLWERPLLERSKSGHVDIPRLQEGNIALQAFSVVTKTPLFPNVEKNASNGMGIAILGIAQGWPARTWSSLSEKALYQSSKLHRAIKEAKGQIRLILNHEDLLRFREDRNKEPRLTGVWLTLEGGQALEGDLRKLDELFEAGFRMIGPAHLYDNDLAGSQSGEKKHGLTTLGKEWLRKMEDKRMIVDLAHLSPQGIDEVLAAARRPVVVSHTGIQKVCPIARNLSDQQIVSIAQKGGLIGVGLWKEVLCDKDLQGVVSEIKHVCDLVGCQHVALGSDWDGFVRTVVDSAHIGWLTYELQKAGFDEDQIKLIMGENIFRFLAENLP